MYNASLNGCYVKYFESNKTMSFKISDNKSLRKYNQIWKKVKNLLTIKFDSEPVYGDDDKYIKTKIKINDDSVNTNFHDKLVPKENASYKCLSLIMLNSVVKVSLIMLNSVVKVKSIILKHFWKNTNLK